MSDEQSRLSFVDLIKQVDQQEREQRDRGTLFELLTKVYLENDPMYRQLFDSVWLLNEVPEEYGIPKTDTGVDLVAKKRNSDELFAIQSKYYSADRKIGKGDIDSFLNEVGKQYYSAGIVFTSTPHWTNNAEDAITERDKPITRIDLTQLKESRIDWSEFTFDKPEEVTLTIPKTPRPHQEPAIQAVIEGFESAERGKLIMAPGTGKTYTSMVIAERLAKKKNDSPYRVLYLVPSIQLLSQALKGWTADSELSMDTIAVCSDRQVTRPSGDSDLRGMAAADIGYPATTDYKRLLNYQKDIEASESQGEMLVVFSTYQSIEVVGEAQQHGFHDFDLIIADEAHRTTGATESGEEDSHFVKVHDNVNVKADKRLYQTATPRVYGERAQEKADEMSALLYDMDDESLYGKELFHLGFGEAVHRGILSDYKVMVLAVDETMVQKQMQHVFADENSELNFDDVTKIIGTWNGLLKRKSNSNELYGEPMKRAIAFTGTIAQSKLITNMFQEVVTEFAEESSDAYNVDIQHADGTMNALEKNEKLDWLKAEVPEKSVKILSNARFLTEGVDVPDLDAVLFMQPRRSEIDIAQAVGRVMRKSPNKEYGYVILPIGVPDGISANYVLDNNEKYSVVWDILNALRSIDERFDAMINKLELNKKKPDKISIIGVDSPPETGEDGDYPISDEIEQLSYLDEKQLSDLENAIYGRIVQKVGTTRYWETWSKDVAKIAQQHITRINALIESEPATSEIFKEFLVSLQYNINDAISEDQAVEMLAQHMITKPVFDALFEEESFALNNPVSQSMNGMIERLETLGFNKDTEDLQGFYDSVYLRAEGVDNLEAKQEIIVELYEKFFKEAFPETTDSLGIVFTPVEIVDFIIHSINDILDKYFEKTLSDENVNILDPFTGTGTFITRLFQSGLIRKEDLLRKYSQEVFANEIVLLSYYIAAINIEETFKEISAEDYQPFEGIVLTDTFDSTEQEATLNDDLFGENNQRLERQQEAPITVIMGNPPYSMGQRSANDDNQNTEYPKLDESIEKTYAKYTTANLKRSLYDSYIRAFKWASNRITDKGVIGFITNASFIDSQSTDGLRKTWHEEFNYIYILNLRGNARTQGEIRRKEAGNVFGSGSRTPIAITILVKDGSTNHEIYYNELGDYLSEKEKLKQVAKLDLLKNIKWEKIKPDENNDWINLRDQLYETYPSMEGDIFNDRAIGISTNRDAWVYNFSKDSVLENSTEMIENYNTEVSRLEGIENKLDILNNDPKYIKWTAGLRKSLGQGKKIKDVGNILETVYRPFTKKYLNYNRAIIERPGRLNQVFGKENLIIYITGRGASRDFSAFAIDSFPNMDLMEKGQAFYLNNNSKKDTNLFGEFSNINDSFKAKIGVYDDRDIFNYVYGVLHSEEYRKRYANDLKKDFPRIPIVVNKEKYISIGQQLVNIHVNYEKIEPYEGLDIVYKNKNSSYEVKKMRFGKKRNEKGNLINDKSTIVFNKDIEIKQIPPKAYEYLVNGRSAIEWIMDQYQIKTDKQSGIVENPNEYSENSQYVFNLLLSIINMSVQTVDLVNELPPLDIVEE